MKVIDMEWPFSFCPFVTQKSALSHFVSVPTCLHRAAFSVSGLPYPTLVMFLQWLQFWLSVSTDITSPAAKLHHFHLYCLSSQLKQTLPLWLCYLFAQQLHLCLGQYNYLRPGPGRIYLRRNGLLYVGTTGFSKLDSSSQIPPGFNFVLPHLLPTQFCSREDGGNEGRIPPCTVVLQNQSCGDNIYQKTNDSESLSDMN